MFVLDTNVVSELRRHDRANRGVVDWVEAQAGAALFISAITLLEIELGVLQVARRDPAQGERLSTWLHAQVVPAFENRVLPVDGRVALRAARLHVPDPKPERDALIAATALVHGFAVVTRNVRDFDGVAGLRLMDPWR